MAFHVDCSGISFLFFEFSVELGFANEKLFNDCLYDSRIVFRFLILLTSPESIIKQNMNLKSSKMHLEVAGEEMLLKYEYENMNLKSSKMLLEVALILVS